MKNALLAACAVLALTAGWALTLRVLSVDAPSDVAFGLLLPDDTFFAPGYSDRGFRNVRPGMTPSEVQSLLGPPLGSLRLRDGGKVWSFTKTPGDTHYYFRTVRFGAEGKVVSKSAGFYVD